MTNAPAQWHGAWKKAAGGGHTHNNLVLLRGPSG